MTGANTPNEQMKGTAGIRTEPLRLILMLRSPVGAFKLSFPLLDPSLSPNPNTNPSPAPLDLVAEISLLLDNPTGFDHSSLLKFLCCKLYTANDLTNVFPSQNTKLS